MKCSGLRYKRILGLLILFFTSLTPSQSQEKQKEYVIEGRITLPGNKPATDAYVVAVKTGGGSNRTLVNPDGTYRISLDFNKSFNLIYSKKGYVNQIYFIDTKVSKDRIEETFIPKEINVELFEMAEPVNTDLMKEPVAKISFDELLNDFDSEEKYASEMAIKVAQLKDELLKQKELNKNNALSAADIARKKAEDEAAQKEAEEARIKAEKEKTKAEALAKKEADQKAKEAEQQRILAEKEKMKTETLARKEAEDKAKADELARLNAEKEAARAALQAQKDAEEKARAEEAAKNTAEKEKAKADALAKKEAEEKVRNEEAARLNALREKEKLEAASKREAEEKAKAEDALRLKKEQEESARLAIETEKQRSADLARKKADEFAALKEQARQKALADEQKRLEDLAKQEEIYKNKSSKFKPVMGIYSNTTKEINGKKAYGYINFGNGVGNQDLTKEEYEAYLASYSGKK